MLDWTCAEVEAIMVAELEGATAADAAPLTPTMLKGFEY